MSSLPPSPSPSRTLPISLPLFLLSNCFALPFLFLPPPALALPSLPFPLSLLHSFSSLVALW